MELYFFCAKTSCCKTSLTLASIWVKPQVENLRVGDEALRQLEAFLEPRIEAAQGTVVNKSVEQVFEETHQETR